MQRDALTLWAVCGASVLALAACSKKTETAPTGAATNATATAPASSTGTLTPPSRKAGLWEQTVSTDQMKQTTRMCLDATVEAKMKWWGSQAGKSECSEQKITPHPGGGWDFHAVCPMGESGTITSDGQATGDFGSHYTVNVSSTTSGSPMPQANGVHKIAIDAVWKGPCPAEMHAGDMEMPSGLKINMMDAMNGKPPNLPGAGHMSNADIAAMRARAMEMAKQMKAGEKQ